MDEIVVDGLFHELSEASSLSSRLDQLRLSGCNRKIAWSKTGCVAYISRNETQVFTRHLQSDKFEGEWISSQAYPINGVASAHGDVPIVHLAWNHEGSSLALVDSRGIVSIWTIFLSMSQLNLSKSATSGVACDDLSGLVGFWWLNTDRRYILYGPARRDQASRDFKYGAQPFEPFGPFHPISGRLACIGLTKFGTTKLWYQGNDSKYSEINTALDVPVCSQDVFTHANFASDRDGKLLLAAYTESQQLRIYRIEINWNTTTTNAARPASSGQVQFSSISPQISIKTVRIDDMAIPQGVDGRDLRTASLSHLELIPPLPIQISKLSYPTVLAVFSTRDPTPLSVVARWEIRLHTAALHSSLDHGATRKDAAAEIKQQSELRRLDDVHWERIVLAVHQINANTIMSFAFHDSTLDFRDRTRLEPLRRSESTDQLSGIFYSGLGFGGEYNFVDVSLSPSSVVSMGIGPDGKVIMDLMNRCKDNLAEEGVQERYCVALAHHFAFTCNNHLNNDDLLMLIQSISCSGLNERLLAEAHRSTNVSMDFFGEVHEKLFRNPLLQRCISLQQSLYFRGSVHRRTLVAKIAYVALNLRMASVAMAFTFNRPKQASGNDTDISPESLQALIGIVRWTVDLSQFITDDLWVLARSIKGENNNIRVVREKVAASNSPSLALVLSSATRTMLRYNMRGIRGIDAMAQKKLSAEGVDDSVVQPLRSLKAILDSAPVKVSQFERLLHDVDGNVKAHYQSMAEGDKLARERTLFTAGEIPVSFDGITDRLLGVTLTTLRNDIDPAALYFYDTTWLGLHDDRASQEFRNKVQIDALRKVPLKAGAKIKRCSRCDSVSEDVTPAKNGQWMNTMLRSCYCGSQWVPE